LVQDKEKSQGFEEPLSSWKAGVVIEQNVLCLKWHEAGCVQSAVVLEGIMEEGIGRLIEAMRNCESHV
jgi:hypothetical protein